MANFKLNTELREGAGKGVARKTRATGRVPAILYGHKENPLVLSVDEAEMRGVLQAHPDSAIVDLTMPGKGSAKVNAIVRDVQRHPASGKLLHVDFQRINLDEKIRVEVHVEVVGSPVGVKEQGGVLEHGTRSVDLMCLPTAIPESIRIDVSELHIQDSLKLKDVVAEYPDVQFLDDPDTVLAAVSPPVVETVPTAEAAAEEGAEPEVVGKAEEGDEEKDKEKSEES